MNITATGMILALVTGLLGAWLFLWMSNIQHNDYRVQESRVACDKARFDTEFSSNFGHPTAEQKMREMEACTDASAQAKQRAEAEIKARKEADELKKSIERTLHTEPASGVSAASGVAATTK